MADILPTRPEIPDEDKDPRVVGLDSDEVDDLLAAIGSSTARELLAELHDEPGTPSEVADRIDTSIQNAQYHLGRLEEAGLIESAGTAYSEKGREMTVYAPADRALVVVAGKEDDTSGLQSVLSQLLGGLGVVALGSLIVDRLARSGAGSWASLGSGGGDGGAGGGSAGGSEGGGAADLGTTETAATETAQPTGTPAPETEATTTEGGGMQIAESTDTPTPEATGAPTATPTAEPTATPMPTAEPTATPMATEEPTPIPTEEPTMAPTEEPTQTVAEATQTAVETVQGAASGGPVDTVADVLAGLSPGAFFFLGGVVALAFVALAWRSG